MRARPLLAVGVVVELAPDLLLLVRRGRGAGRGLWSVPGGHVEAGETLAEAVVREVREETGLEVACGPFLDWVELPGGAQHYVIMEFRARLLGEAQPEAGDDATEARWVPKASVGDLALVPGLEEFLIRHGVLPAPRR